MSDIVKEQTTVTKQLQKEALVEPQNKAQQEKPQKQKKVKKQRKHDDQYNYDPTLINQNTVIPKPPKKNQLLTKPDQKQYKAKQEQIIEKIKAAKQKRQKILAEKFERQKKNDKGEAVQKNIYTQFEAEKQQVNKIRQDFYKALDQSKSRSQKIKKLKEELQLVESQIEAINKSKRGDTKQNIFDRLRRLQKQLLTSSLSLKQQKQLQHQIQILKRNINSATSVENLEIQLAKLLEQKTILKQEIDRLKQQRKVYQVDLDKLKPLLDSQNEKVAKLKQQIGKRKQQRKNIKDELSNDRQLFYEKKTKRKQAIDQQIQKLRSSIDALWIQFQKKYDQFTKQQRLINYIEWQTRQKNKLIRNKQYQQKRKQYQLKQKQRQQQETVKIRKNDNQIKLCSFLIDYCLKLKPQQSKQQKKQAQKKTNQELFQTLNENSQWKKQKGLTILASKKDKKDLDLQVNSKKNKKNKKPQIVQKQQSKVQKIQKPKNFTFDLQILNSFQAVKVLPPLNIQQIDKVVSYLKEKQALYLKQSTEQESKEVVEQKNGKKGKAPKVENRRKQQQFPQL